MGFLWQPARTHLTLRRQLGLRVNLTRGRRAEDESREQSLSACLTLGEHVAVAKFAVIMPAAGASSRFNDKNYKKPFAPLADRAVWLHSAEKFLHRPGRRAVDPGHLARGPRVFQLQILGQRGDPGDRRRAWRQRAVRFGRKRHGPAQARGGLRGHPRRGPAVHRRRLDHQGLRGGRAKRRGDPGRSGRLDAEARARTARRSRKPYRAMGCGRRRRRKPFAARSCSKPTAAAPASRPPTMPNWSSGSASRSPSCAARRSI